MQTPPRAQGLALRMNETRGLRICRSRSRQRRQRMRNAKRQCKASAVSATPYSPSPEKKNLPLITSWSCVRFVRSVLWCVVLSIFVSCRISAPGHWEKVAPVHPWHEKYLFGDDRRASLPGRFRVPRRRKTRDGAPRQHSVSCRDQVSRSSGDAA